MAAVIKYHKKNSPDRDNTYVINSSYANGARRVTMTLHCAKCPLSSTVNWSHGYEDTMVGNYWRSQGWDFHAHNKRSCICPECKGAAPMQAQHPKLVAPITLVQEVVQEALEAQAPRLISRDQRHKIRELLEVNFDDEKGRYTKDWSDKRIADQLDLPLATIREIREAAYGPIDETDPELVNLREEYETLKALVRDFDRRLIHMENKK